MKIKKSVSETLPVPLGPTMARISELLTTKETELSTLTGLYWWFGRKKEKRFDPVGGIEYERFLTVSF